MLRIQYYAVEGQLQLPKCSQLVEPRLLSPTPALGAESMSRRQRYLRTKPLSFVQGSSSSPHPPDKTHAFYSAIQPLCLCLHPIVKVV